MAISYEDALKKWYDYKFQIFLNNPEINWRWDELTRNDTITLECIQNNLDKQWDWKALSRNKTITLEFIQSHIYKKWDWDYLFCKNSLKAAKNAFIQKVMLL